MAWSVRRDWWCPIGWCGLTVESEELPRVQVPIAPSLTCVHVLLPFWGLPVFKVELWLSTKGVQHSQPASENNNIQ